MGWGRAGGQGARRARLRADRTPGRAPGARAADESGRLRPVRDGRAVPRARSREPVDGRGARTRRLPDLASAAHGRHARRDRRGRDREDARRRPDRQRRTRRSSRRRGARRRARVGQGRGRRDRRLRPGAVRRPAAARAERHRHSAPRRVHRRGAGPGRADRRRAGCRRARGRPRHERGQHPDGRRRRPGGAGAVHPARGQARAASRWSSAGPTCAGWRSRCTASSPTTTPACSRSRR